MFRALAIGLPQTLARIHKLLGYVTMLNLHCHTKGVINRLMVYIMSQARSD